MDPEEFITYAESLSNANKTGSSGKAKKFFRSIYIGYDYPNLKPPSNDEAAREGYEIGLELRKEYHEKFK